MTNDELQLKEIIKLHFKETIDNIKHDFSKNCKKKKYNFLVSTLDKELRATMVFVSSFESKSGNTIEACAKDFAKLRYGEENVPTIVNPNNIPCKINHANKNQQIIITNVEIENKEFKGKITAFRTSNESKDGLECKLNQDILTTDLLPITRTFIKEDKVYTKPVDLAYYDGTRWNVTEIKAGGDLDSSNAPSNIDKLLTIYAGLNIDDAYAYFSTLYNKNGEGNNWTGCVKKYFGYPKMFKIGSQFWNDILPFNITFDSFVDIYKVALYELKLEEEMKELIRKAKEIL